MLHTAIDFGDEDTEPGDDDETSAAPGTRDEPSFELMWVEEAVMGMVLRVRRFGERTR